jgi:HEAT repeat protein
LILLRANRTTRRAARERRKQLERELACYRTTAERDDLLATLDQMDTDIGKLPILAAATNPNQSQEVRTAAIDSLADLDEPGALQMLQGLTNDPDPQIREAAKTALQSLAEAEKETPR